MPDYLLSNLVDARGVPVGANEQGNFTARPGGFNPDTGSRIPLDQPQALIHPPAPVPVAPVPVAPAPVPVAPAPLLTPASAPTVAQESANTALYKTWADAQPATREVNTQDLVQTQLNTILASDSPYIVAARQKGREFAAKRGLLNSSIAAGASQTAAIQAALPIARQDASTYFSQGINNQNAKNTFALALKKAGLQGIVNTDLLSMRLAEDYAKFQQGLSIEQGKLDLGYAQIANSFAETRFNGGINLVGNGGSPEEVKNILGSLYRLPADYAAESSNSYARLTSSFA